MYCEACGTPMMPVYSGNGWAEACIKCGLDVKLADNPGMDQMSAEKAYQARSFFATQDFERAEAGFRQALEGNGQQPEYLWAALLAKYGIKYCETQNPGAPYTVNFWKKELPGENLVDTDEYAALCDAAAARGVKELRYYEQEAEEIGRGLTQIRHLAEEGVEYDVFLSFKDMGAEGKRTPESRLCEALYQDLRDAGRKVFYSRRTLAGKLVTDFEGYIHTALRTSKLLVLATSREEYVCSPWVASEWQRYLKWNKGEEHRLMTCRIGDMSASKFPRDLSRIQHELHVKEERIAQQDEETRKRVYLEVKLRYKDLLEREKAEAQKQDPPHPPEPEETPEKQSAPKQPDHPDLSQETEQKPQAAATEPDPIQLLIRRAEQGDADAQNELGDCYDEGRGVEQSAAEAVKWYRKAAEQGHAKAQNHLGVCYYEGKGIKQSYAEAAKWCRKAAEQGDTAAQYNLGYCYYRGKGLEQSCAEAVKWYRKAAEQGYAAAQYNLGYCYYKGKGVEPSYAEAVKWCRKAAEQGDAAAQNLLGYCYYKGKGVEQNRPEAEKWCRKAAKQGHAGAQKFLEDHFSGTVL